ncbi:sensor histidine kinase [Spirillospora sp. CA-294931]|uniref:sensor histidine kinase n=1 Tax=Spirillospora sp. CA-294931 TaxID=3240042 RepID=UPI003D94DE04
MATPTPRWRLATAHAPWSPQARRDSVFVASGVPLQLGGWAVFGALWGMLPITDVVAYVLTVVSSLLVLLVARPLTSAQRQRFWAMLDVDVPPLPARHGRRWDLLSELRSEDLWRALAYHMVVGPAVACGGVAVVLLGGAGVALASLCAFAWALPSDSSLYLVDHPVRVGFLTALGLLMVAVVPWIARAVRRLDVRAAVLLGPSRAAELERRVEDLAEKRAHVVDAADLERRRIERDLHDGAQQRLVSLAMNLGLARETLTGVPEPAMKVIVEAHEEAKEALTELRDLIRGLHPAVLEDRGLDAALSGLAARVPLAVRLRVDVEPRASSTVEAVAYFVVSESLANVVKHARASSVDVTVARDGDVLRVAVRDDGVGGADPSRGTGLTGLARRVGSVDGTFRITSPAGGPTTVTVELPCAL